MDSLYNFACFGVDCTWDDFRENKELVCARRRGQLFGSSPSFDQIRVKFKLCLSINIRL
jgi:hypothetical protein